LFKFIDEAGGQVHGFYFSECWDEAKEIDTPLPLDERGNMVFVVKRRDA
jgi:hypothetical protein